MRAVRRWDTGPELAMRSVLRRSGLRFCTNRRDLPGSPDIVFPERQVAVFVHGCFWHRHPRCRHASTPKTNVEYWRAKFEANVERDRRKIAALQKLGWRVIVLWQCEIEKDIDEVARRVESTLRRVRKRRTQRARRAR